MSDLKEQLLDLKGEIEELSNKKARLEGVLSDTQKRLKDEFNCEDFDAAEQLLEKMKYETEQIEQSIQNQLTELQDEFDI